MDPVPDPLLLRKPGSAGNLIQDLGDCIQELIRCRLKCQSPEIEVVVWEQVSTPIIREPIVAQVLLIPNSRIQRILMTMHNTQVDWVADGWCKTVHQIHFGFTLSARELRTVCCRSFCQRMAHTQLAVKGQTPSAQI
jgi:hypothetical protein